MWDNLVQDEKELVWLFLVSVGIALVVMLVLTDSLNLERETCPHCGSPEFYMSDEGKEFANNVGEEVRGHQHGWHIVLTLQHHK